MSQRKAVVRVTAKRYQRARKKEKVNILSEFIETTGYHRSYASYLLKNHGRRIKVANNVYCEGSVYKKVKRQPAKKAYDDAVFVALKKVWVIMDTICGKRLAPNMGELVRVLGNHGELDVSGEVREKLCTISASTIDRLLKPERKKLELKVRSNTKPGIFLKHQIPIRTFADWNEQRPGFIEMDLVGHEGGDPSGEYIQTLDMTDISSTWTETEAVRNKAQKHVFKGLENIRARLPFDLLGLDSDNGSEFINAHLLRYCEEEELTFTRGRAYKKNDGCYVEQKNYSIVRKAVGYYRYDTDEELKLLNELYKNLRLFTNYFQPTMKLMEKSRNGARVYKRYDKATTPYQRILDNLDVSGDHKSSLREEYQTLNPAELKRNMETIQDKLLKIAKRKMSFRTDCRNKVLNLT